MSVAGCPAVFTVWLSMLAARTNPGNTYAGTIYVDHGPPFNNFVGAGVPTEVGSGTLTFTDAGNGSFLYMVNGVMQTKSITRFLFAAPGGTPCQ